MGREANATFTNLFIPTSGRDTSHPCLISTWPKEWCTIVCVISFPNQVLFALGMGWGANATLTNLFNSTMVHPPLGQVLIRQRWKASLPDVELNKFVRVASTPWPIPKANNTWLGKDSFLPHIICYHFVDFLILNIT